MTSWTRCWLATLFVGCSPLVVCSTESFIDFDFFSAIFISWIIKDIQKAPHRRLEIKEVSEQGGSDPPRSTRHTHLENYHHWQRPSCNQTDMQQWCQFQEPVWLLIAMAHSVYSVMVTISSRMNLNFMKIYSPSNVSIKRMGSVPKNSVPSQYSQSNKYKTEQPFLSGVWAA